MLNAKVRKGLKKIRSLFFSFAFCILHFAFPSSSWAIEKEELAKRTLEIETYYEAEQFDKAEALSRELLGEPLSPAERASAQFNISTILMAAGKWKDALLELTAIDNQSAPQFLLVPMKDLLVRLMERKHKDLLDHLSVGAGVKRLKLQLKWMIDKLELIEKVDQIDMQRKYYDLFLEERVDREEVWEGLARTLLEERKNESSHRRELFRLARESYLSAEALIQQGHALKARDALLLASTMLDRLLQQDESSQSQSEAEQEKSKELEGNREKEVSGQVINNLIEMERLDRSTKPQRGLLKQVQRPW